jgi:hypothetical protein
MNKWLIAFALLGISVAGAKTYDITLSDPSAVGKLNLQAGQYELRVKASTAIFKDLKTGQSFQTTAKVEQAPKKFQDTEVESKQVAGRNRIEEIRLHGTTTKLEFD